jgi:GPH family glycoside/pentoside/hexuronide:cation symporter
MAQSLPKRLAFVYSLGQLGWSMQLTLVTFWLTYVFVPTDLSGIPVYIPQIAIFGFLTIIGIISLAGRLVDAVTDPWIATLSDRSSHPKGRRISFMRRSAIPAGIVAALLFISPVNGTSAWNVLALTVSLFAYYLFYTMYVTPYFSLIAELGHTTEEKLNLSTYISLTWFLGYALTTQAAAVFPLFESMGMTRIGSMRLTFVLIAIISTVLMLLPALIIDEKKYSEAQPSTAPMIESLKAILSNRWFRPFIISDFLYWFSLTIWQTGTLYYVTVLLLRSEQDAANLVVFSGVLSFALYALINLIAKKIGKKQLMLIGYISFIVSFLLTAGLGILPISSTAQYFILIPLFGLSLAIFGILPNAIIADVAEFDARRTGIFREGMFFGARTFVQKLGVGLGLLVFNSLLLLGNSSTNSLGIRLTAVFAAAIMSISLIIFIRYREREVLAAETRENPAVQLSGENDLS